MREAIVLAGGLGTRLQGVLGDTPKVLAPIQGRPFLEYLLHYLAAEGIQRVSLALGYKAQKVLDYLQNTPSPLKVLPVVEPEPLGTGGALAHAWPTLQAPQVFVLNGDTFFPIDLKAMAQVHARGGRPLTLALAQVKPADRYGVIEVEEGTVRAFREKEPRASGWIYGGIALIETEWWRAQSWPQIFSWETYLMEAVPTLRPTAYLAENVPFIDIGIPSDYDKAQTYIPSHVRF